MFPTELSSRGPQQSTVDPQISKMGVETKPFDVSTQLAELKHEKKNQSLHRLPPNATVQRRPIIHAAIASPFAGRGVQKIVYVSSKTPIMSAVKRVKRLLYEIEKRATQDVKLIGRGERAGMQKLAEARERLAKEGEEVLVKASGRAMHRAVRVGEWFRNQETEMDCKVEVRTGSVSVVDDIVELDDDEEAEAEGGVAVEQQEDETVLEGGDTTLELLGDPTASTNEQVSSAEQSKETANEHSAATEKTTEGTNREALSSEPNKEDREPSTGLASSKKRKRSSKKKKRQTYDPDDLPEQRMRWIKTVEVAISFRS